MARIRMTGSPAVSALTVGGVTVEVIDGVAEVDSACEQEMIAHGFQRDGVAMAAGSRADMVRQIMTPLRSLIENLPDEVLGRMVATEEQTRFDFWADMRTRLVEHGLDRPPLSDDKQIQPPTGDGKKSPPDDKDKK